MWRRYKKSHWYYRGATPASRRTRRKSWRELAGQARATLVSHWRWTVVALALIIAGITLSYMGNPTPDDTASQLAVKAAPSTTSTRPFHPGATQPTSLGAVPPAPTTTTKPGTLPNPFGLPRAAGLPFTGLTSSKAPAATTPAAKVPTPAATSKPPATATATTAPAKPRPTTTTTRPAPIATTTTSAPPPPPTTTTTDDSTTTTTTDDSTTTTTDDSTTTTTTTG